MGRENRKIGFARNLGIFQSATVILNYYGLARKLAHFLHECW